MDEEKPLYSQAIFWIDVEKIQPNPYQPRRDFGEEALMSLAESIRQYGVLQPLVVSRQEMEREEGGIAVFYELIAGERRWRAARIAGLREVPALIREKEDNNKAKLELAIIENLQREDLNPIERARAFSRLHGEFSLTHAEIAGKIGKSREYVSNTVRLLLLPDAALEALQAGRISEGHARPLLMLHDRETDRDSLLRDIVEGGLTVREAEMVSRRIAHEKVRKPTKIFDRETRDLEQKLAERFGTRVWIERKDKGGKISIEFFSPEELANFLRIVALEEEGALFGGQPAEAHAVTEASSDEEGEVETSFPSPPHQDDSSDEDLYSVRNFSI